MASFESLALRPASRRLRAALIVLIRSSINSIGTFVIVLRTSTNPTAFSVAEPSFPLSKAGRPT